MRKKFLAEVKEVLDARRREIVSGATEARTTEMQTENDNLPDPNDQASSESELSFTIRLKEREQKLLSKIDEAIQRLSDGTFGICESCGGLIGEKRLLARPVTTMCIDCKTKQEESERRQEI